VTAPSSSAAASPPRCSRKARAGPNSPAAIGVDRSTVSQLLSAEGARLPNAQVVAECAAALGVTADWLLGLSDRPEQAEPTCSPPRSP
jgi:hypothetical protein